MLKDALRAVMVVVPGELTTMAGRRLRSVCIGSLKLDLSSNGFIGTLSGPNLSHLVSSTIRPMSLLRVPPILMLTISPPGKSTLYSATRARRRSTGNTLSRHTLTSTRALCPSSLILLPAPPRRTLLHLSLPRVQSLFRPLLCLMLRQLERALGKFSSTW